VAVVALGYNDSPSSFAAELDQMLAALAAKGVQRTVFVNLSTRDGSRNYDAANAALAAVAAVNPSVTVLDWAGHSGAAGRWRWFDNSSVCCGIHLNRSGQAEFAVWLRGELDALRLASAPPPPATGAVPGLPLAAGHRGHMVAAVQQRLNAVLGLRGAQRLNRVGQFGESTRRRIRQFQRANAMPATGRVDALTWQALGLAADPEAGTLRVGTRHPAVKRLHRMLGKVLRTGVRPGESYTYRTAALVRTFQLRAGLPVTGRVDATTWGRLIAAANG